jgi:ribokinase
MAEPTSVLVAGSINVDIVVHAERLPGRGETVAGGRLERTGGGKGANQAVAAARAGAAVTLAGAVGDDDLGADALAELSAEAVDVGAVRRLAGVATGVALIVVDGAGDNQIAVASGANHEVTAADVRAAAASVGADGAGARADRTSGAGAWPGCVLASFELLDEPVLAAAQIAAEAGCPLVVNPAPARPLDPALCGLRPILTPNRPEAAELTGEDDPEAAARALAARTGAPVVVTLGEQGALVVDAAGSARVPAPAVRSVDTTGAGDAFNGVLAAELARGHDLPAAVAAAVAAASESVTRPGARG